MAYLLIIAGLISIVSGVLMLTDKGKQATLTLQPSGEETFLAEKAVENQDTKLSKEDIAEKNKIENERKGREFENYIVNKFGKEYFKLVHWQGDKGVNGIYPESNQDPDLQMRFKLGGHADNFAVECKWRKRFFNGKLQWGEEYKLNQYLRFSKEKNLPVFLIIGVGGSPGEPKYLYIIPLGEIKSHILDSTEIKQFLKTDDRSFYWDLEKKSLS